MTEKISTLKIWKNIKLDSNLQTGDDFRKSLRKVNCSVGVWGNAILGSSNFIASCEEREVDLVLVSVAELGYGDGATGKNIYDRAHKIGLNLCSTEVGPHLRIQYLNQPKFEQLFIAMNPVFISLRTSGSFSILGRTDFCGSTLDGIDYHPDDFWNADSRWIFLLPKCSSNH